MFKPSNTVSAGCVSNVVSNNSTARIPLCRPTDKGDKGQATCVKASVKGNVILPSGGGGGGGAGGGRGGGGVVFFFLMTVGAQIIKWAQQPGARHWSMYDLYCVM